MPDRDDRLWDLATWLPALEKFGAATHLTVSVFADDGVVAGPFHGTPLFGLFAKHGYDPGIAQDCARRCLDQAQDRPAILVSPLGLAAVGTSLVLEGRVVGAAVAAYALIDFCRQAAIEQLAREARVPLRALWEIARAQPPVPERRLRLQGELLQVLGDAILRENVRTRRSESAFADLTEESSARDDFLAVLSHELRSPLTPILAWARMLQRAGDAERVRRAADVIERNALAQARLVDDLLELTRVKRGKMNLDVSVQDLSEVLRGAVDDGRQEADAKEVSLTLLDAGEPLLAKVDVERFAQVFRNVLSNALKFTPPGGRISVEATKDGADAVIRFEDTGEGVAPEFVPFVFDPFRQQEQGTRREHPGLGIGLALVKELIELHRGHVTLTSDGPGRGTVVTIRVPVVSAHALGVSAERIESRSKLDGRRGLVVEDAVDGRDATRTPLQDLGTSVQPAADGPEALDVARRQSGRPRSGVHGDPPLTAERAAAEQPPDQSEASVATADLAGVHVLVLEDDRDTREIITAMFQDCGAMVTAAATVEAALSEVERARPDVFVTDLSLPRRDGYDFIRSVRALDAAHGGTTPAVALTGHASSRDRERVMTAGFQRYLAKPIDLDELVAAVAIVIDRT